MAVIQPTDTFGKRDPPSDEPKEQYLFLLEFFVHRVTGERLAKLNRMFFVPTSVCLKFLHFDDEDISVTPVDPMFEPQAGFADDSEAFDSGRSIMFAIARDSVADRSIDFNLKFTVLKKMPENIKPDIVVGKGELDMTNHFAALRKEMLQCWHTNYPPPKSFDGSVDIYHDDENVGSIVMYVRISGFGESIVTEIETPSAEKKSSTYVFKSLEKNDKQLAYTCRMIDPEKMDVCKDSKDDSNRKPACQVCMPTPYSCSPCGLSGAETKSPDCALVGKHDRSGGEADEAVKSLSVGKAFVVPWDPRSSERAAKTSHQAHEKVREFQDEAHARSVPIQSSRGPAGPCGRAVVLKVSGLLDVEDADGRRKQPTVTVAGESDSIDPEADREHDVFVLRIGKKGIVGAGEKSDIQLEMRTPKGPERRPPIRYETREMQTEEDTKTKALKGKNGKGKNKKKKKK